MVEVLSVRFFFLITIAWQQQSNIKINKETTMDNVQIEVNDNKAVITIDLSKDFGPSKSGKTIVVATTRGNVPIPGAETVRIGINCYKYPE